MHQHSGPIIVRSTKLWVRVGGKSLLKIAYVIFYFQIKQLFLLSRKGYETKISDLLHVWVDTPLEMARVFRLSIMIIEIKTKEKLVEIKI